MTVTETSPPIRWGILGTARIATKVGRAIHRSRGAVLAAVASRDKSRAQAWIARHTRDTSAANDTQAFLDPDTRVAACGSYLALLENQNIDAVYIPLPPSLHCEWTCLAARYGKHVLCEKPLAMDLAEAQQMSNACAAAGRQLMDGVMWAHHERTGAMREIIRSGALGSLRRVTAGFTNGATLRPDDIRFQREMGGGALGDLGWYCVGALSWAFDELPERVFATARYEQDVDRNLSALLWFRDGRMAAFDCGFDVVWRKWFEIAGTQGTIVCDDFVNPWDAAKARFWVHDNKGQGTQHLAADCVQEVRMIENFCDAVRSGELNPAWPAAALATQKVCDALDQSARTQTVVDLK